MTIQLKDIKTGDILGWRRNRMNLSSDLLIRSIRVVTDGDYGHVGVAIWILGHLFVLEATLPLVKLSLVDPREEIFHLRTDFKPKDESINFLIELVGLDYGIADAVRGALGKISKRDDKWQCAEIVIEFCKMQGIDYQGRFIPDDVMKTLSKITGNAIRLVEL